jgi:hypothetical protein
MPIVTPLGPIDIFGQERHLNDSISKDERITATALLSKGGFPRSALREGAAVMGAESGYKTDIDNGICCIGLMQINYKAWRGKLGIPADEGKAKDYLKDPVNNVTVAHEIWKDAGGTFTRDWEARQNGAYRRYLGQNPLITVTKNTLIGDVGDAVGGAVDKVTDPLGAIGDTISFLSSPDSWFRIGKGVLGGWLIVLGVGGIVFVVAKKAVASPVGQTATDLIPGGGVAKTALKIAK